MPVPVDAISGRSQSSSHCLPVSFPLFSSSDSYGKTVPKRFQGCHYRFGFTCSLYLQICAVSILNSGIVSNNRQAHPLGTDHYLLIQGGERAPLFSSFCFSFPPPLSPPFFSACTPKIWLYHSNRPLALRGHVTSFL